MNAVAVVYMHYSLRCLGFPVCDGILFSQTWISKRKEHDRNKIKLTSNTKPSRDSVPINVLMMNKPLVYTDPLKKKQVEIIFLSIN